MKSNVFLFYFVNKIKNNEPYKRTTCPNVLCYIYQFLSVVEHALSAQLIVQVLLVCWTTCQRSDNKEANQTSVQPTCFVSQHLPRYFSVKLILHIQSSLKLYPATETSFMCFKDCSHVSLLSCEKHISYIKMSKFQKQEKLLCFQIVTRHFSYDPNSSIPCTVNGLFFLGSRRIFSTNKGK